MDQVTLPPDLQQFADEAVASGRYRDASDVVRAGLALLRDSEAELADFVRSLEEARLEGERDGFLTVEEVGERIRTALAQAPRR